ncbi:HAD superfamily hydrolase (TIGR01509 family)/beta-phosphoglucomutase family hydrolase [Prolixibacter denitrificans]|uniref:Hydrolase n=2 Tax=Prolixibacter denitrificans TaxID=1541063 RepID=A0A2P8CFQ9_9BACT|nr:HAD superfamily hydrolase (TIGR01509 family)/beta-phosphoglucomutase family hydrolase [Prolixibacter denitrificans]GET23329.1 hydrolase [Prolixibacter denitrificans]
MIMESRENVEQMGIIFDMDGVIIDSNPLHIKAWRSVFEKENVFISDDDFSNIVSGTTGDTAIRTLLKRELTQDEVNNFNEAVDAEFRRMLTEMNVGPVKGLRNFLERMRSAGHRIVVATSAPTKNVDMVMNKLQLREYFEFIIDRTRVTHGKPHPEIYLKTLEQIAIPDYRCVVFEDSLAGVKSAVGAGLRVIGVTTSHSAEELNAIGASLTIKDFDEVSAEHISTLMSTN